MVGQKGSGFSVLTEGLAEISSGAWRWMKMGRRVVGEREGMSSLCWLHLLRSNGFDGIESWKKLDASGSLEWIRADVTFVLFAKTDCIDLRRTTMSG